MPYPAADVIGLKHINSRRAAFAFGFVAVILVFALPGSLLNAIGLYSYQSGGNPLSKFHPATYAAVLGSLFALYGRRQGGGLAGLFRDSPALAWSVVLIVFCMVYSAVSLGISGVAVYVDTFLAAGLAAIALDAGTHRQRQILGYTIMTFCVINVFLSIYEEMTQTLLLPSGVLNEEIGTTARGPSMNSVVRDLRAPTVRCPGYVHGAFHGPRYGTSRVARGGSVRNLCHRADELRRSRCAGHNAPHT